jgi:hypothetical protein
MVFTLDISLLGLIALVYVQPTDLVPTGSLTALLPDATEPSYASDGRSIPGHKALLVYCCENLLGGCQSDDKTPEAMADLWVTTHNGGAPGVKPCSTGYGTRLLNGISIEVDQSNVTTSLTHDVSQIQNMLNLKSYDQQAHVAPAFMNTIDPKTPYAQMLAAKASFTTGNFMVASLLYGGVVQYYPGSLHDHHVGTPKYIADETVIDLDTAATAIVVTLNSYRGAAGSPWHLTFQPYNNNNIVPIAIINVAECPQWMVNNMGKPECSDSNPGNYNGGNHHFETYYELAADMPPSRYRAVPKAMGTTIVTEEFKAEEKSGHHSLWIGPLNLVARPMCPPGLIQP